MNKKILIGGSAIAVVVLVLASLSPVVGYNSVESSVKDSPLFAVRTKRAIQKDADTLICNYIGQGKTFLFPNRNSRMVLLQKVIERISRMDDKTFNRIIYSTINDIMKDNTIGDININKIITDFYYLKTNPEILKRYVIEYDAQQSTVEYDSCFWFPGCMLLWIFYTLIGYAIVFFIEFISFIDNCPTIAVPETCNP